MSFLVTRFLVLLGTLWLASPCGAEMVVVTHPKNGVERLSRDEVIDIFLGRYRVLPNNLAALPVDMPATDAARERFYRLLVGKDLAQINSYWARLITSGRTAPPLALKGVEEILVFVAANRGAVAYLERSQVDARVRVVLELP